MMTPEMERVRNEIEHTRAQIGETASELQHEIARRADRAKQAVNPLHYAREYPWIAVGLALGTGLAVALTGADAKAARAAVEGAKSAGSAVGDGAVAAKDAVVDKFSGDESAAAEAAAEPETSGLRSQASSAIHDLLNQGLDEILGSLGVSRERAAARAQI